MRKCDGTLRRREELPTSRGGGRKHRGWPKRRSVDGQLLRPSRPRGEASAGRGVPEVESLELLEDMLALVGRLGEAEALSVLREEAALVEGRAPREDEEEVESTPRGRVHATTTLRRCFGCVILR